MTKADAADTKPNKSSKRDIRKPHKILVHCDKCEAIVNAEYLYAYEAFDDDDQIPYRYYFCKCPSCGDPFVAISGNFGDWNNETHWDKPARYLPPPDRSIHEFPKILNSAFEEARSCFRAKAYTATAVMCRKTLEGICKERGITETNLAASLRRMRENGVIDSGLYEWADALRISGNEAAHGVEVTFTREDAQDILEFTRALLEYIFTFREKFEHFQKRRKVSGTATS